jgi:hypothetical protein
MTRRFLTAVLVVVASCNGPSGEAGRTTAVDSIITASRQPGIPSDPSVSAKACESADLPSSLADTAELVDLWIINAGPLEVLSDEPGEPAARVTLGVATMLWTRPAAGKWFSAEIATEPTDLGPVLVGRNLLKTLSVLDGQTLLGLYDGIDVEDAPIVKVFVAFAIQPDGTLIRLQSCGAQAFETTDALVGAQSVGFTGTELDLVVANADALQGE